MRVRTPATLARISLLFLSITAAFTAAAAAPDTETLVPIAPCRLLDTAANPSAPGDTERQVTLDDARCARIVPLFATAYSVVITRTSNAAPEKMTPGTGRVSESPKKVPVPGTKRLTFPLPSAESLAVDVVGYYVAAGTPLAPQNASTTQHLPPPPLARVRPQTASSTGPPAPFISTARRGVQRAFT